LTDAGAVIALGTDHNPGTSGLTSMSLVIALAVGLFKLSAERALIAATVGGALSLSRSDRGVVAASKLADLVLWEAEHEGAFAWAFGLKPRLVWGAARKYLRDRALLIACISSTSCTE
jgi:imidazolonepropionase